MSENLSVSVKINDGHGSFYDGRVVKVEQRDHCKCSTTLY